MQATEGVADVNVGRDANYPQFEVKVDREKAASVGLSQRDIAQAALFSLNSNASVNPSIFTDPRTGNQYNPVGRDLGSVSEELEGKFRQLPLPAGFTIRLGGQTEQQREAFGSLAFTSL